MPLTPDWQVRCMKPRPSDRACIGRIKGVRSVPPPKLPLSRTDDRGGNVPRWRAHVVVLNELEFVRSKQQRRE
ncbi:hypothetical protein Pan216_28710 [Planctomycetes bacterium Pan216]|uniref:Uncharacterized protein n=1 Tax=Kolteria novifilia TaxID=2527975 RepID=A0A518B4V1_9BACT|nr:hypothetical protein Pan216_28710 [Planctomycetes bacterium Pan216]